MSALLAQTTIAGAVTGQTPGPVVKTPTGVRAVVLEARFLYGSGGTTAKAWVQTRLAGGTWQDVASFAFTTAAATRFSVLNAAIAAAASAVVSDAALADNTIANGLIGDEWRVKYTTAGTYAGATSLAVDISFRR